MFYPVTLPFAVCRSSSIPEEGFFGLATHSHCQTPRSHPKCPSHFPRSPLTSLQQQPKLPLESRSMTTLVNCPKTDPIYPIRIPKKDIEDLTKLGFFSNRQKSTDLLSINKKKKKNLDFFVVGFYAKFSNQYI